MGLEAVCAVSCGGPASVGKAHCGDGVLEFSGDFRLKWKWSDLESVVVEGETLVVVRNGERADFELGESAEKWRHAILNPRSVVEKMGLKPTHQYQLWGNFEPEFLADVVAQAGEPAKVGPYDVLFVRLLDFSDLSQIVNARAEIKRNGMIWVLWAKGRKEFNDSHIRAYCLAHGLVDVKIASVSSVLTSCKYVIPVKDR